MMFIIKCLYFMIPGIFANMAPVMFKNKFKALAIPVDLNHKFRGKPIFGKHKTYRGFIAGIPIAIIITYLQTILYQYDFFRNISIVPYAEYNFLILGFLIGFGALFGDLIESFFKRQLNYKPGQPFVPFDQIDAAVGALIFVNLLVRLDWLAMITIILLAAFLSISTNNIAFYLKIRKEKW